jgi:hypothetical protein
MLFQQLDVTSCVGFARWFVLFPFGHFILPEYREIGLPSLRQIPQHYFAGLFGRCKRFERGAGDLDGGPVLMAPGGHESGTVLL